MKKILIVLALLLVVSCSPEVQADREGLEIITSSFPLYDFARVIAGDDASVAILLPPGAEVHSFEVTPSDIKKISSSDLFLYVGGSSDEWMEDMLGTSDLAGVTSLGLMEVVELLEEEESESMVEEEDDHHDEYDEHIWLSTSNAQIMVDSIAKIMGELDEENREEYLKRASEYNLEIAQLERDYQAMVASSKKKEIIVGDRFPFLYLVKSLGLDYDAAYPGCSANVEENAQAIRGLIDKIREDDISTVFYIEMSRGTIADRIAEETGAKKAMLHSVQNVTKEEMEAGEGYLSLMRKNLLVLEEALN